MMRSHYSVDVTESDIDSDVTLCGWVDTRRDHGGVVFVDLRDRRGIVQVVTDPDAGAAFTTAESLRSEFVIKVKGRVRARPEGTINESLPTGRIEVMAKELEVLNASEALPFQLDEDDVNEAVRLKHRYLDLRRPSMQRAVRMRHEVIQGIRSFLNDRDFCDIETPILTKSTPEGARDYLVPSRTYPGQFFALPQSPQIFKQLLMVSGFERYYQIARCFRDEDLRADRQPEFTQLDVEMSFIEESDIMGLMEEMVKGLFKSVVDVDLGGDFPRMTYAEAMHRFGTDRPDLRIDMELTELTEDMKSVEFKVFSGPANSAGGRVAALKVPGGGDLTRQQIDQYTEYAKTLGAGGLAYIKVNDPNTGSAGLQSPIVKFLSDDVIKTVLEKTGAAANDLIFFGADRMNVVNDVLSALRLRVAADMNLVNEGWRPLWVVDFPLVEYSDGDDRFTAIHHPFTAPLEEQLDKLESDPGQVLSRAYDLVMNGAELGGGSIRIHSTDVQSRVFKMLGIEKEEAEEKFGFLLDALRYGAPPHGGIAFGIDRMAAMMSGHDSIRDVIAFPKTQRASCLMTEAPSVVDNTQLRDLGLRLRQKVTEKTGDGESDNT